MGKIFILTILISIIIFLCLPIPAYSLWEAFKDVEDINTEGDFKVGYIDIDGDFINEIIIEKQYGVGSNHYQEDMRIFKDPTGNEELELIFYIVTLDSTFGFSGESRQYNCDIISGVEFSEPDINSGLRDIIVKSKKIYYKDEDSKIVDRIEDLGTKIFKWNRIDFVEDNTPHKVDLDNDGREELIITEDRFATDLKGVITVSALDKSQSNSFSMPDHFNRLEFISLNKDGFKQIVAWSSGGAHYTNIAIYGYKDGRLYEIFKNGSACGILTYFNLSPFDVSSPTISIGSPNWGAKVLTEEGKEINWSYASDPLWKIYTWEGKEFIYDDELSSNPEFSENEELERYLDKAKSLRKKTEKQLKIEKEVAEFARQYEDFEQYRPLMHKISLRPENENLSLQELYDKAKEEDKEVGKILAGMLNVEYYFNGRKTTYKEWKPLVSMLREYKIGGNNVGLFDSFCFFEAYTKELEEEYNTNLDMDDMPLSEVNRYFAKRAKRAEKDGCDILITTLIEDFYVEKGFLPQKKREKVNSPIPK